MARLRGKYILQARRELGVTGFDKASSKRVFKRAWALQGGSRPNPAPKQRVYKARNPTRKRISMPRRRYTRARRRSRGMKLPIAPIAGLMAGMLNPVSQITQGNWENGLKQLAYNYTGLRETSAGNFEFDANGLKNGIIPLTVGLLVHKYVGGPPLNANRMLARAGVPLIRI